MAQTKIKPDQIKNIPSDLIDDYSITYEKMSPNVSTRQLLSANATYYVATTGNDTTGDGSSGSPWATIQHAIDYLAEVVDMGTSAITIQLADGNYSDSGTRLKNINGTGAVTIKGNSADISAVEITSSSSNFSAVGLVTNYNINYLTGKNTGTRQAFVSGINNTVGVNITSCYIDSTNSAYGYVFTSQAYSTIGIKDCTITGNVNSFIRAQTGTVKMFNTSMTWDTGSTTNKCNLGFVNVGEGSNCLFINFTYTGNCQGKYYAISQGSGVRTGSSDVGYLPGDTAGTLDATSYYG